MKKIKALTAACVVAMATIFVSAIPSDGIMTKEGKTTIVNTQLLGKKVRGFRGATPLKIYIEKNKVIKIEALKNQETPKYMAMAKKLLANYEGKTVKKAAKMEVDGVSGATFTSKSLKKNVQLGLEYYQKNK